MKRIISIFLMASVLLSVLAVSGVTASAASSETVNITSAKMDKNGTVSVSWRTLSYCKYYRVFYKIDNTGWVKAADVSYNAQGNFFPGQVMTKKFTVPLYRMAAGNGTETRRIYVTVRGMDRDKKYNTDYRACLAYSNSLFSFTPRLFLQNVQSARATFAVYDPQNIDTSTKFRVFYRRGNSWKAIGDFYKNNAGYRFAVVTLNVPLYKYDNKALFTVRGINDSGQYTTPYLNNAVVPNYPDLNTYQLFSWVCGQY